MQSVYYKKVAGDAAIVLGGRNELALLQNPDGADAKNVALSVRPDRQEQSYLAEAGVEA